MPEAPEPQRRELFPEAFRRPVALLWTILVPQLVLLALNLRAYALVCGELDATQRDLAFVLFGFELFLLACGAVLYAGLRLARREVPWLLNAPLLLVPIAYLWLATAWIPVRLLPPSVTTWLLPPERLLYLQYAFMMPAAFYAAARLACFPVRGRAALDLAVTLFAGVAVPVAWYVAFQILAHAFRFFRHVPGALLFLMLVASTLVVVAALIRLAAMLMNVLRLGGEVALIVLSALVGLAGPLGGLWLNRAIPFPADFQSLAVYVLAVLNGVALLLPSSGPPAWNRFVWLLRCACYPFTVYFFVVFLPFLPLALLAILAAGTGFLVLTPTALMVVHTRRIVDGWREAVAARGGRRALPLAALLVAFAVMPGWFAGRTLVDRHTLRRAIAYAWAPDFDAPARFEGSRVALRRGLLHLRDFKEGVQLPFLSGAYNAIVFDGLVLPDAKLEHLHRLFFGTDLPEPAADRFGFPFFGRQRRHAMSGRRPGPPPPTADVRLGGVRPAAWAADGAMRTQLLLTMHNDGDRQEEFVATLRIPDAVLVSGFWLTIGTERVPGRIFEKKAAMWVYEMIRDMTRRDPGLLVYRGPGELELRVFPFAAGETRTAELELLWPDGVETAVEIGGRRVDLASPSAASGPIVVPAGAAGAALVVPRPALESLPPVLRRPYAHFVIDRSASATNDPAATLRRCAALAGALPGVDAARVTFVNYEQQDLTPEPLPLADLEALAPKLTLPARGGFDGERALQRVLTEFRTRQNTGADPLRYPLPVLVSATTNQPLPAERLAWFGALLPDAKGFFQVGGDGAMEFRRFDGTKAPPPGPRGVPVVLFRYAGQVAAVSCDTDEPVRVVFPGDATGANGPAELQVYSPDAMAFVRCADLRVLDAASAYARGTAPWIAWLAAARAPANYDAVLPDIVRQSRETGVLVPATSCIVVENSAQWKMLERAESKKLASTDALEFMETPAPPAWLLGAAFAVFVAWYRRRPSRRAREAVHAAG